MPPAEWTDYFRGQQYDGGKNIVYTVDPYARGDIPLFVRAAAILPTEDVQQYVGQRPGKRIYFDVFPAPTATSFVYYDNDGVTYAYENDVFYQQRLTTRDDGTVIHFDAAVPMATYAPALDAYKVRLHGIAARAVTNGGTAAKP